MESQLTISGIVFIVCLIVPGVIFKRFYFQGQFSKQFGAGLFADRLITSIFWDTFVQIITFLAYSRGFGFTYTGIKNNIDKVYSEISKNLVPNLGYHYLVYILGYLFSSVIVALILGHTFHKLVRMFRIDLHQKVFRFANEWNYYFRGEILLTNEFKGGKKGKVLSTTVDLLIDDGTDKNKMVSGFLTQYTISQKTGDLEAIYLTNARRYSNTSNAFKVIPGDCFIVPFGKVIDMNLNYNIQEVNVDIRRNQQMVARITAIGFIGSIFLLVYPWFLRISVFDKLSGFFFSMLTLLLLVAISISPYQVNESSKLKGKALFVSIALILLFGFIAVINLHVFPGLNEFVDVILQKI